MGADGAVLLLAEPPKILPPNLKPPGEELLFSSLCDTIEPKIDFVGSCCCSFLCCCLGEIGGEALGILNMLLSGGLTKHVCIGVLEMVVVVCMTG